MTKIQENSSLTKTSSHEICPKLLELPSVHTYTRFVLDVATRKQWAVHIFLFFQPHFQRVFKSIRILRCSIAALRRRKIVNEWQRQENIKSRVGAISSAARNLEKADGTCAKSYREINRFSRMSVENPARPGNLSTEENRYTAQDGRLKVLSTPFDGCFGIFANGHPVNLTMG